MERISAQELLAVQAALREAASEYGCGPELGDFDVIVRLTAEFCSFLLDLAAGPVEAAEVRYKCESVFSGVESFCQLATHYRMMSGEIHAREWKITSFAHLNDEFAAK